GGMPAYAPTAKEGEIVERGGSNVSRPSPLPPRASRPALPGNRIQNCFLTKKRFEFERRLAHPQRRPQYQVGPFFTMPRNDTLQKIGDDLCSITGAYACYRPRNVGAVLEPGLRDSL